MKFTYTAFLALLVVSAVAAESAHQRTSDSHSNKKSNAHPSGARHYQNGKRIKDTKAHRQNPHKGKKSPTKTLSAFAPAPSRH